MTDETTEKPRGPMAAALKALEARIARIEVGDVLPDSDEVTLDQNGQPVIVPHIGMWARVGRIEKRIEALESQPIDLATHAPSALSAPSRLSFAEFYAVILPSLLHANPRLADPPTGCAWGPGKGIINAVVSQWQSYIHGCALFEQYGAEDPEALLLAVDAQGAKIQAGIEAARRAKAREEAEKAAALATA